MSRSAISRAIEAFFSRWPLYALLVVAALAAGYLRVQQTPEAYVATGSILADTDSLVTAQSGVDPSGYYGYLSPAQFTSQELFGLIVTDVFMEDVVATAEIELSPDQGTRAAELGTLRLQIASFPTSGNIVQINATTPDPDLSARLARAVIDEYIKFKIEVDIAESGASGEFFSELTEPLRLELLEAQRAVDEAAAAVTESLEEVDDIAPTMSLSDDLRISRLREAEALARQRYQNALEDVEVARLAELQTETNIRQSFTVLDVPEATDLSAGRVFYDLLTMVMFAMVGIFLVIIATVAAALGNSTVIFPDDLNPTLPVGVIATLPKVRRRALDLRRMGARGGDADGPPPTTDPSPTDGADVVDRVPAYAAASGQPAPTEAAAASDPSGPTPPPAPTSSDGSTGFTVVSSDGNGTADKAVENRGV